MKKYLIYIVLLIVGIVLGGLIFSNLGRVSEDDTSTHSDISTSENQEMWTCSMHPQIMQPEPGDCPICGMDLIPAESGSEGLLADQFKLTENAMALANVQTSIVGNKSENSEIKMLLSGKIMPNEKNTSVQSSYFEGRLEKLHVNFTGEKVRKGQLLATIYSPTLIAAQQELLITASMKDIQPALHEAVRNKLKLWKISDNQINEIENSGKVRENFPIYATVSGTVSEKIVSEGDYVQPGESIIKLTDLSTVWAIFDVYENQISHIRNGQQVIVTFNALPKEKYNGKVSFIDPLLDMQSRTVKVRVVLNNTNNIYKPGMFVEGRIEDANSIEGEVSIPSSAVLWTGERSVVYIKTSKDEPIFEMREIVLGNRIGKSYQVLSGLEHGDEIVTNGTFTIDAAAQLQGKKSMMNKEGEKGATGHVESEISSSTESVFSSKVNERMKVDKKFQQQLKVVYDNYINVKDALVNDDTQKAKVAATTVVKSLEKIDMKLLTDKNAHKLWMTLENEIKSSSNSIAGTTKIKDQRNHFMHLSAHLISAVEGFGINEKVYRQFCPMADNDKGAYWLSKEKKILNPYFGASMLTCGEVTSEIQ